MPGIGVNPNSYIGLCVRHNSQGQSGQKTSRLIKCLSTNNLFNVIGREAHISYLIGGAHQQTSERAAPPVSVEEKGKATGDKIKMLLFLLMSIQPTVFMLLGGPQNTIKSHLVFTALFCFAAFSVFSSRMSAPYSHSRSVHGGEPE
jgi:hypothetical protein